MPEQPGLAAAPEPDEPLLRAGTWKPKPRARHARPESVDDDPLRLAPDELPWGIPARAGRDGDDLPPAIVLATGRTRQRTQIVAAAAAAVLLLLVVVLAVVL